MYARLRKECSNEMIDKFRAKTTALFIIVASEFKKPDLNQKTSSFLYSKLLAKFSK